MTLIDPGLALALSLAGALMLVLGGGVLWLGMRRLGAARRLLRKADAAEKRPEVDSWQYRFLEQVLDRIQDCVVVIDVDGRIVEVNDAAARLFQRKPEELLGESLSTLVEPSIFEQEDKPQAEGNTRARTAAGDAIAVAFSSCPLTEPDGPTRWAVVFRNLSSEHRAQKRIRFLARYDMLTRIPNRMEFQHRLQQATARALRNRTRTALLYIDMDKFKDVNDRLGHPIGDRALEIMSRRLVDGMDSGTLTGRLGGDEFGLLLEGLPAVEDPRPAVASVTRDLLDSMSQKFHVEGHELLLTASIGVAVFPDDAENVIDLIRNADAAMYHAKQNGGNTYGFYSPDMNADAVDRLLLKNELRSAIQRDEFELLYQPKVDLRDGRIAGCEALLRWRHSRRGDVPPTLFIPLAEESTLIFEIGEWVLETVCRDFTAWQRHVPWPGRVALNLSLRQLRQPNFAGEVEQVFRRYQLTPSCVELEITESTLADHGEQTLRTLDRLYELGLHLSIDDFGTGYSSLSSLQHFPIGTLKIDRSFIENAGEKRNSTAIVGAIVGLGRSLGMDVVAEGIESMEQLGLLQRIGCTYGQGHLFGTPVSGERYLEMLLEQQKGQVPHAALFSQG
jgi:diguanylate cyclase (GGDEF)-like protein/PAS domain S-box-containing protein